MRWIGGIIVVLLTVGFLLANLAPETTQPADAPTVWRRTAAGWERSDCWRMATAPSRPSLNPLVVAAFGTLLTAFVLVAAYEKPLPSEPD